MSDGREGGFIKAHRQWESSPAVEALSAEGEVVWLRLLFAANWKDSTVILRNGPMTIKRGQALIAERTLAERARVGRKVVRTTLERLVLCKSITVSKVASIRGPSVNLITIVNYDKFQAFEEEGAQGRAQARPKLGPSSAQSEEREEGKNLPSPLFAALRNPSQELPAPARGDVETPATQPKASTSPSPKKRKLTPQAEAWEHWRDRVWWRLSTDPCPDLCDQTASLLAARCRKYGVDGVKAAMDRVVTKLEGGVERDVKWLRENLTLACFCADAVFPKFLARVPTASAKPASREVTGLDRDGNPIYAETA